MKKKSSFSWIIFKIVRGLVHLFYEETEIIGLENLPEKDAIIVGNHSQMNGPIVGELFMPDNCYIWCAGEMMHTKEVPEYAFNDFWAQKPKRIRPFYKLLSYIIAPLASCIFTNARTVAVYHDGRVLSTFKSTVRMMEAGRNMLIFPEKPEKNNNIVYQMQEHFVDVAKMYYKKTGKEITFVPMYIAPAMRKAYIGKGIKFNAAADMDEERVRIIKYLSDEITGVARALPEHTVVPYKNIPKKYYLSNKDINKIPE